MFESKKDFNLGRLISSLKVGDVIYSTIRGGGHIFIANLVLLRLGDNGEFYFSYPQVDAPISRPDPFNPYRWDEERETLLGRDGDIPPWYQGDISIERGRGIEIVEEYNKIPRSSGTFIPPTQGQINDFLNSDLKKIIRGILENGESGEIWEQLSFVFKAMGFDNCSAEQMIAFDYLLSSILNKVMKGRISTMVAEVQIHTSEEDAWGNQTKH